MCKARRIVQWAPRAQLVNDRLKPGSKAPCCLVVEPAPKLTSRRTLFPSCPCSSLNPTPYKVSRSVSWYEQRASPPAGTSRPMSGANVLSGTFSSKAVLGSPSSKEVVGQCPFPREESGRMVSSISPPQHSRPWDEERMGTVCLFLLTLASTFSP